MLPGVLELRGVPYPKSPGNGPANITAGRLKSRFPIETFNFEATIAVAVNRSVLC